MAGPAGLAGQWDFCEDKMKFSEVKNHIGEKINLNGECDLAMNGKIRPYIWPPPEVPFVFTIIKITRSGRVYIQCDKDKKFFTVNAINVDLINE